MKTTGSCVHAEPFLEEFGIPLLSMKIIVCTAVVFGFTSLGLDGEKLEASPHVADISRSIQTNPDLTNKVIPAKNPNN